MSSMEPLGRSPEKNPKIPIQIKRIPWDGESFHHQRHVWGVRDCRSGVGNDEDDGSRISNNSKDWLVVTLGVGS